VRVSVPVAACLAFVTAAAVVPASVRTAGPGTADLLARYIQHPADVGAVLGSVGDLDAARGDLDRIAPRFLAGLPEKAAADAAPVAPGGSAVPPPEQRRRDLVTFALDLAGANVAEHAPAAGRLVEWACYNVRRHTPASDFDHRWQLAALALIEGTVDPDALREHLAHVEAQFPGEPRAIFARALADEQATAPLEVASEANLSALARARNPSGASPVALMTHAAASYRALLTSEPLRPEATVRLAHVQVALGQNDQAVATLATIDQEDDGFVRYLGYLIRGIALDHLGRPSEAQAAFRSALELGPHAHAPAMALASSLFRSGQRSEADRLMTNLLANDDPTRDVWWSYWAGDYRLWGLLISRVREFVK
jgi:tetratricopeptide (TPR) repeat protein